MGKSSIWSALFTSTTPQENSPSTDLPKPPHTTRPQPKRTRTFSGSTYYLVQDRKTHTLKVPNQRTNKGILRLLDTARRASKPKG